MRKVMAIFLCVLFMMPMAAVPVLAQEDEKPEEAFVYDDHGKKDPLLSLVSPAGVFLNYDSDFQIYDLSLEGIMEDPSGNLAIINGRIVKEGDQVGNFTVEKITDKTVNLIKGSQNFLLRLKKGG